MFSQIGLHMVSTLVTNFQMLRMSFYMIENISH
jgi:hypothetical protein